MDRKAISNCRKLLRLIECEAVTDTSDQNLYDILIRSKEKKTVLLTWLIQNLFTPNQCSNNSLEDLLSIFMTNEELTKFLEGTLTVAYQFKIWTLLMNTVYQVKNAETSNPQNATFHILSGKLLDELIESWNQKVERPAASLVSRCNPIEDLQNQLSIAKDQLKRLNSQSESSSKLTAASMNTENEGCDVRKFLEKNRALNHKLNQCSQLLSNSSECMRSENFVQEVQKNLSLNDINRHLVELRDMVDVNLSKNVNAR